MKRKFGALLLVLAIFLTFVIPASAESTGVQLKGIDVSSHQGTIDWSAVKNAGIQFAIIRDGYGGDGDASIWNNQKDAYFEQNYTGAVQNGIAVGAYHYSYAKSVEMASQEADECLYILNGRHLDYPVAFDVEEQAGYGLSDDTLAQIVQTFCSKIQQAGYKTAVYTYKNYYVAHLNNPIVSQYDAWIAHTGGASSSGVNPCAMWQYSQEYISGISGICDMDYSYVNYAGTSVTPATPVDSLTFRCDTPSYTFGNNSTYTYKITTPDTFPPTATSSNPSAVAVSGPQATYQGFLFTLKNVGTGDAVITTTAGDGRSVSFHATGTGTAAGLRCDTSSYTFGSNSSYYYKITTPDSTAPTASSSNPSAVTVSFAKKLSDGYLYRISNAGKGDAVITTTASDGASASFHATGADTAVSLRCDTAAYTFGSNSSYYYKITTPVSEAPTASSSNPSAVTVSFAKKLADGYLYQINNVGKGSAVITTAAGGTSVSFTAQGSGKVSLRCDTSSYNFGSRTTYCYKVWWSGSTAPKASSSNSSAVTVSYAGKTSDGYLYRIRKAGKGSAVITTAASNGSSASFTAS